MGLLRDCEIFGNLRLKLYCTDPPPAAAGRAWWRHGPLRGRGRDLPVPRRAGELWLADTRPSSHLWLVQVGAAVKLNCCPGHKCVFVDSSFSCAADRSDNFFMKSFEWDVSRSSRYFTIFTITPFLDILRINHTMCSNNSVFTLLTQSIKTHVFLWKHLIILGISFFSYMYVLRRLCAFALQCHYFLLLVKSTKTKRRCWGILGRLYIASENPFPFTHWLQDRILFDSMITNWIVSCFSDIQMEKEAAEMDPADLL